MSCRGGSHEAVLSYARVALTEPPPCRAGWLSAQRAAGWGCGHLFSAVSRQPVAKLFPPQPGLLQVIWFGEPHEKAAVKLARGRSRSLPCSRGLWAPRSFQGALEARLAPCRHPAPRRARCCLLRWGSTKEALFFRVSAVAGSCLRCPEALCIWLPASNLAGHLRQGGRRSKSLSPLQCRPSERLRCFQATLLQWVVVSFQVLLGSEPLKERK